MQAKHENTRGNDEAVELEPVLAALARLEAVLRAANRNELEESFPKEWAKGRRRKILEFCAQPRTRQQIREYIGKIAGYEVKQYLDEGVRYGVLACYGAESSIRYVTALRSPPSSPPSKTPSRKQRPTDKR